MHIVDPKTKQVTSASHSQIMAFSKDIANAVKDFVVLEVSQFNSIVHYYNGVPGSVPLKKDKEDRHGS